MPVPDTVFSIGNALALLGWVALIGSPPSARWSPVARRLAGRVLPVLFAFAYVTLFAAYFRGQGGFGSIAEVRALFDVPGLLVAGWLHYLAFDLFVGAWIAERAAALGIPQWQVVPVLLLTFLFGPAGFLAFTLLRALRRPESLTLHGVAT